MLVPIADFSCLCGISATFAIPEVMVDKRMAKLIAYVIDDHTVDIRPAPMERAEMSDFESTKWAKADLDDPDR